MTEKIKEKFSAYIEQFKPAVFVLPSVIIAAFSVGGFYIGSGSAIKNSAYNNSANNSVEESKNSEDNTESIDGADAGEKVQKVIKVDTGILKNGIFSGSARGYGGTISVKVTVYGGKIKGITIVSHSGETPAFFDKAKAVVAKILEAQSVDVDTVSGATYSSNGILNAVADALSKAGDKSANTKRSVPGNTVKKAVATVKKTKAKNGKPADGVFDGSSVCEKFGYTVSLKAKFKDGKPVALYGMKMLNSNDSSNDAYMARAWREMVKRIIGGATDNGAVSDVDSVSGATYSSNAVISAYLDARNKAIAKSEGKKLKATAKPTPVPSKKPTAVKVPKPVKVPRGAIADGKYKVSAVCEPDEDEDFEKYTLSAWFTFKNGKCTAISDFSSTAESNKNYYMKAAKGNGKITGITEQILKKQSADDISAVSGATCSSKTIVELYIKALDKAAKKAGVTKTPTPSQSAVPTSKPDETGSPENTAYPTPTQAPWPSQSVEPTPEPSLVPLNPGTYKETVTVYPDESNDFEEYTLTADVIFNDNRFCGFDNVTLSDETNRFYYNKAVNGTKTKPGLISQINAKQNDELDGVSGATCTSNALIELFSKAWNEAKKRGLE